jgi:signal transduction histidine kinase
MARVFEPFFTTKPFGEDGGIGLAMARGVVEAHHGTIRIDEHHTPGCAIVITLPITPEDRT